MNGTLTLVTGATGMVGRHVVAGLRRLDQPVRALTRDLDRAEPVLGPAEGRPGRAPLTVQRGDLDHDDQVAAALAGVERVVLCVGNSPQQAAQEIRVIEAARRAGVRRLVKISARGAAVTSPVALWRIHAEVEQRLSASGLPAAVLRPSTYASNLLAAAAGVAATGCLFAPAGDAPIAFVDPRDVAAMAVATVVEDGHEGRTYTLSGPEAVPYAEVALRLGAVLGRRVDYVDVPPEAARGAMLEAGLPAWLADQIVAVFAELRHDVASTTTDDVDRVLGRAPRPVQAFLADHRRAFAALPVQA